MARKIIQIDVTNNTLVFALCDDDTIWLKRISDPHAPWICLDTTAVVQHAPDGVNNISDFERGDE